MEYRARNPGRQELCSLNEPVPLKVIFVAVGQYLLARRIDRAFRLDSTRFSIQTRLGEGISAGGKCERLTSPLVTFTRVR